MRKLQPGDLLEILGDDPGIREDMPVWCERAGHRLLEMKEEEGRHPLPRGEGRAAEKPAALIPGSRLLQHPLLTLVRARR